MAFSMGFAGALRESSFGSFREIEREGEVKNVVGFPLMCCGGGKVGTR